MEGTRKLPQLFFSALVAAAVATPVFGSATTKRAINMADLATLTNGSVSDVSPIYQSYFASKLFDGILTGMGNRWLAIKTNNVYVVYKFNAPTTVNAISLFTPGDDNGYGTAARAPKTWTFSGSHDGETWTTLDTQPSETGWPSAAQERFYLFENSTPYTYYKFNCTANNGAADYVQLIELDFYNCVAPVLDACAVEVSGGNAFTVSAEVNVQEADTVSLIANDGTTVTTNVFATAVSANTSVTGTVTGLATGKTYELSVLAENDGQYDEVAMGTYYLGELTLGAATDASEVTLTAGTVEVSRASADPLPLAVKYSITGNVGTEGVTWEAPVAIEIPAGSATGSLLVKPLVDVTVAEDVTATVALAGGNYGIPAAPGNATTLTIQNASEPAGYTYTAQTITNAFDNPAGGFFTSAITEAIKNTGNLVINFVRVEDAPEGLREFAQSNNGTSVEANANSFSHDWLLTPSLVLTKDALTTNCVRYAAETVTGLKGRQDIRAYAGSWYVPADGTYSFRMHMAYAGLFSLDGKLILRQPTTAAVTTNGVELTAGWHSFYVAFLATNAGDNSKVGPANGETLGFSFSASNEALTAAAPGHAFDTTDGYKFSTAFTSVLVPSIWAKGGDVIVDCANIPGDLRVAGQIASIDYRIKFANLPAGRTLEVGRPANYQMSYSGYQNFETFAYVKWTSVSVPPGVNIRFEGSVVVDNSWTVAGRSVGYEGDHRAFSLGRWVVLATEVPDFFGRHTDEFVFPDGLLYLQFACPEVLGDTATIRLPRFSGIGLGGAPFTLVKNGVTELPIKLQSVGKQYRNDFELGSNDAVLNGTSPWDSADSILGNVTGGNVWFTGWGRRMSLYGNVNVREAKVGQRGDRIRFLPKTGSAASVATLTLSADMPKLTDTSLYVGSACIYLPETPGEHPLSVGTLDAADAVFNESLSYARRLGATVSTCSNCTINVGTLKGKGVHLRTLTTMSTQWDATNDDVKETDHGFANFVFGEINGNNPMKVYVSTNVNITVTNIVKAAAFDYAVMASGINAAVLDIEGTCAAGTTVKAADIAMLPARVKGLVGDITLTDETEGRTYPVTFDFDRGVPVGGCDGSGRLAAAPSSGTIELSLTGEPVRGTWGILRFDDPNGKLDNWTVTAPRMYGRFGVSVIKDQYGFSLRTGRLGLIIGFR